MSGNVAVTTNPSNPGYGALPALFVAPRTRRNTKNSSSRSFAKRLCDVYDDELNRIAQEVRIAPSAFKLVKHNKKLVRFYLPLEPEDPKAHLVSDSHPPKTKGVSQEEKRQVGEGERITTHLRAIADANPLLKGIIDRVDFNATTHGQRP